MTPEELLKKFAGGIRNLFAIIISFIKRVITSNEFKKLIAFLKSAVMAIINTVGRLVKKTIKLIPVLYEKLKQSEIIPKTIRLLKSLYSLLKKRVLPELKSYSKAFYRFLKDKLLPGIRSFLILVFKLLKNFFDWFGNFALKRPGIFAPALVLIYLIIFVSIIYYSMFSKYYWTGEPEKRFSIKSGKNVTEIVNELKEQDIIRNAFVFKIIVKLSGDQDKIISRNYIFKNGMSNMELLTILTDKTVSIRLRIPEGFTIKQVSKLVESKLAMSAEKFIVETQNDSLIGSLGLKGKVKNLEGFLFPDTYQIPAAIDEKGLVEFLIKEFVRKVQNNPDLKAALDSNKIDILFAVTLGSIIEAETPVKSELPVISGVYHNRLNKKMKLQADPTVNYVIPDGPKQRLLYEDLKYDSPYNTYLYSGLPPGPINNPGLAAILAAVNPEKNNYLYFVATGEGGHKFSVTYEEHQKAIKEYRKKQK